MPPADVLTGERHAGVLLHPTSLPGPGSSGVLGGDARRWLHWLAAAGFRLWQVLPFGPVGPSLSPYQVVSAFAGNPRLIDPEQLAEAGWLTGQDWEQPCVLEAAWAGFQARATPADRDEYARYWQAERGWLLPYALFQAARRRFGDAGWWTWPAAIREHAPDALAALLAASGDEVRRTTFEQWTFDRQWQALRSQAQQLGIALLGDLPIYVDLDSADVWWSRRNFRVSALGVPAGVAGVPPDYFSADGQVWGNPLYDWEALRQDGFRWWVARVRAQLRRFDYLRIDHFRALEAYWVVAPGAAHARDGHWEPAPGAELLAVLLRELGYQPFLAEDLGTITPAVHALRQQYGLPGMLVAQFAFDGSADNPYLPDNQIAQAVLYPGTHDNDTTLGWSRTLDQRSRDYVQQVLGTSGPDMPDALLRSVWSSRAEVSVFPLQDLLGLGSEARMNVPGTVTGNWQWRFSWDQLPAELAARCRERALASGRWVGPAEGSGIAAPGFVRQPVPVSR